MPVHQDYCSLKTYPFKLIYVGCMSHSVSLFFFFFSVSSGLRKTWSGIPYLNLHQIRSYHKFTGRAFACVQSPAQNKEYKNSNLLWDGELWTECLMGNKFGTTSVEDKGSRIFSEQMPSVQVQALFARRDVREFSYRVTWTRIMGLSPLYPDIHKVQTIDRGVRLWWLSKWLASAILKL